MTVRKEFPIDPPAMYRILYVDDEKALLEIAKVFLEADGQMSVDTRASAITALPLIESAAYDAVISDYQMPGMDGIVFLKNVRAKGNTIPFILFTGKGREEVIIQALNEGADFYLQKGGDPVSQFAELSNKIRYAVNRKRAEQTLQEKTAELDRFFNSSLDLICIADTQGTFRRLNPEWERTFGYPLSELEGKRFLDLVHPDDIAATMEALSKLGGKDAILNFENRYRHKDGSYRWIEWRSYPYGNLIYAAARDITDRKRAEEALRESEERLRLFIREAPAALAMFDREMHYLVASRRWMADYHLGDRNIVGRSHYEIFPEIPEALKDIHRRALSGEVLSADEEKFEREDGSVQWLAWEVRPWYSTGNTIGGIIIFSDDVTERIKSAEALRESEEKYRRIVETSIEGIWSMDSRFITVFVNRKMADMLGYTVEEMLGVPIMEFMDPAEILDNEKKLANRRKGINESYERKFRRKDGTLRWFWVSVTALMSHEGAFAGSFAMLTDITDRKQAEEELNRKNEELGAAYEQLTASEEELRQNLDELAVSQRELLKSERKFRDLFNNAILGIFRSTPEGHYIDMNPAFAHIAGYSSPEKMMKAVRNIQDLYVRPNDRQRLKEMLSKDGEIRNFETEIRRTNGSVVWIAINAKTMKDKNGQILSFDGTIEDITDRRQAEMELSRSNDELRASHEQITATEEELRQNLDELTLQERDLRQKSEELENRNRLITTLLDTIPIGVFMVEAPSGKPIMANREAGRMLGRGVLPGASEENLSEVYEAYRLGTVTRYPTDEMPIIRGMRGETSHIDDMEVVRPDGTRVLLEIFGNPVYDFQGRIIASLVSFLDITGRKKR
jgi:PAS domain S-box-containing protein